MDCRPVDLPASYELPSPTACLGIYLATRTPPSQVRRAYRDAAQVIEAMGRGEVALHHTIRIAGQNRTVGRYLVEQCLPAGFRGDDAPWDRARLDATLSRIQRTLHVELAARCGEALEILGSQLAARTGFSLAMDDFTTAAELAQIADEVLRDSLALELEYRAGEITDGERFNRTQEVAVEATTRACDAARDLAPPDDPLAAWAAAAPRALSPEKQRTWIGPIERRHWGAFDRPVLGGLARGLDPHAYFMCSLVARGLTNNFCDRAQQAVRLAAAIDAAIGGVAIVAEDCGTTGGTLVEPLREDGRLFATIGPRVEGYLLADALRLPDGREVAAGALITPELAAQLDALEVAAVRIRDPLACDAVGGVCARCFGLAPEDALWPVEGDPVGARAVRAITAAAPHFVQPSFHIC